MCNLSTAVSVGPPVQQSVAGTVVADVKPKNNDNCVLAFLLSFAHRLSTFLGFLATKIFLESFYDWVRKSWNILD